MAKIIVVEDDADLRRTVCSYLNLRGYEPVACENALSAYDALAEGGADAVVSDIMMPGIDGFELTESLRRHDAELPILFMQAMNLGLANPSAEIERVLKLVRMTGAANNKFKNCSLGMKQRIGVAASLMGHPRLLVLDEPINGLDADGMRIVRETLVRINREEGATILISSHILGELAKIATHYGVLREGRLVREVRADQMEGASRDYVAVRTLDDCAAMRVLLGAYPEVEVAEDGIHVYGEPDSSRVAALLFGAGIAVREVGLRKLGLEEYYIDAMTEGR